MAPSRGALATDLVTGAEVGYLLAVDPRLLTAADGRSAACRDTPCDPEGPLVVRIPAHHDLAWPGAERTQRYVVRTPPVEPPAIASAFEISPARTPEDKAFVASLLVQAIIDGYGDRGFDLTPSDAHLALRGAGYTLEDSISDCASAGSTLGEMMETVSLEAWVAFSDGLRAAHATIDREAVDVLTEERFVEIIDFFVLPVHRKSSCLAELVATVDDVARAEGRRVLGHVVWNDDDAPQVAARLTLKGWDPLYDLWKVPAR